MPAPVAAAAAPSLFASLGGGAGVGSLLSGFGSLASVFGKSKPKTDPAQAAMYREQMDNAARWRLEDRHDQLNAISLRAADARRAGLHPLFALGGGSSLSPVSTNQPGVPLPGQSYSGSQAGDALAGVGSALRSFSKARAALTNRYDAARVRQAEAEADKSVMDLMLMKEEYARTKLNPNSVGQSGPVATVEQLPDDSFTRPPTQANSLFAPVVLPNGKVSWGINTELEEFPHWVPAAAEYAWDKSKGWWKDFWAPYGVLRRRK